MFAGGPGIFIHQAAGVPEGVWGSTDAEVAFALDGPTAVRLGGADVWSDGMLGESILRWRLARPEKNILLRSELAEWRPAACGAGRVLAVEAAVNC